MTIRKLEVWQGKKRLFGLISFQREKDPEKISYKSPSIFTKYIPDGISISYLKESLKTGDLKNTIPDTGYILTSSSTLIPIEQMIKQGAGISLIWEKIQGILKMVNLFFQIPGQIFRQ